MNSINQGFCPACGGTLKNSRLICENCKAEYPIHEPLSIYDTLSGENKDFLSLFLKSRGNIKAICNETNLSYPTIKRKLDLLLEELGFEQPKKKFEIDMTKVEPVSGSTVASNIIRKKMYDNNGEVTIELLDGKPCTIHITDNGNSFVSDKLNNYNIKIGFDVFDVILQLLQNSPDYTAKKGNGHGKDDKVGYGKCTADTVMGTIAINYWNKKIGESTYDPVFVLAAMMDWADIAYNKRGYIKLKY